LGRGYKVSQEFDKYEKLGAYHYDWYDDPNWAWYKLCVDRCVDFCKGSTLDVGCGDGLVANKIAENYEVLGVDNSQIGIELAREKGNARFRYWDLSGRSGINTDYMVCLNVIEHLDSKGVKRLLNLFDKHINKAGIIITDEATDNLGRYHEHEYTLPELKALFKDYKVKGFKIKSTEFGKPITFIGVEVYK